jgi:hypothetical protein
VSEHGRLVALVRHYLESLVPSDRQRIRVGQRVGCEDRLD